MVSQAINPEMMVIAREARELTQGELAKLLSVSQGKISKMECGLIGISEEMLRQLSIVLDFPKHFFSISDPLVGFGVGMFYHRKRQSLSSVKLGKIHAEMNIRRIQVLRLLRSIEMKESKFRYLDIDEYDGRAEDIAGIIRGNWLLPRGPIKDLTKTIEDAGGIVVRCDFGTNLLDALSLWVQGAPPLFFINKNAPCDRLRFNLAHELAHIIMHRVPNPNMEDEANRFAAEFLMPAEDIAHSLSGMTLPKLASLKPFWKVSMAALLKRASDLGKITERTARYLWMQMGKAGFRSHEPSELDLPIEEPRLLDEIMSAYQHELKYSTSEICHLLAIHEHELRSKYLGQKTMLAPVNQTRPQFPGNVREFKPKK